MQDLSARNAREVLAALGQVLADRGERVEVVIIGGTALLLANLAPDAHTTPDVDVLALGGPGHLTTAEPLPAALVEAATDVAKVFDLRADWFNSGPTSQLDEGLPPGFEQDMTTLDCGGLVVRIPSRAALVALKFYAATDASPSNKHAQDLERMLPLPEAEVTAAADWTIKIRRQRKARERIADLVERLTKS